MINLVYRGKITEAGCVLHAACFDGQTVTRRARGFSNYVVFQQLVVAGYAKQKPTGPKGGLRLHATKAGRAALIAAKIIVE
jgi:hypothetical protein